MSYNFEIFHMREKQIPVDSVEMKEPIHAFAWEPVGSKFAIIHGDVPNVSVSFYEVRYGHKPTLLSELTLNLINDLIIMIIHLKVNLLMIFVFLSFQKNSRKRLAIIFSGPLLANSLSSLV